MAKAVYKADPQLLSKFFGNMSQGAVNAIKEIMEYSGDVPQAQVDESQMKILDAVKSLEAEGKIAPRQAANQEVYIIDGGGGSSADERRRKFESMGSGGAAAPAVPGPDPAQAAAAAQYLSAGVDLFNQGKMQESLQYLEYASNVNPGDAVAWQYLGAAYNALQRVDEAVAAYERYAAISGDPAVNDWLANFKQQAGR